VAFLLLTYQFLVRTGKLLLGILAPVDEEAAS
jgi:hypothetical protein